MRRLKIISGVHTAPPTRLREPHLFFYLVLVGLLAACSRPASTQVVGSPAAPGAAAITIEQVQVTQGTGLRVNGTSSLPAGDCFQTGVWINDELAGWWPADVCIEPDGGQWEMVIALGQGDTPTQLDPQSRYEVRAWLPDNPDQIVARLAFTVEQE